MSYKFHDSALSNENLESAECGDLVITIMHHSPLCMYDNLVSNQIHRPVGMFEADEVGLVIENSLYTDGKCSRVLVGNKIGWVSSIFLVSLQAYSQI